MVLPDVPQWVVQLFSSLAGAAAMYGAIRADLRHAMNAARQAHRRIDDHMRDHVNGEFSRSFREHHE
jgi:hypothetical protein